MDHEQILALGTLIVGVLTGLSGLIVAIRTQRRQTIAEERAAKKDEMDLLRDEVGRLHVELDAVKKENNSLHLQVTRLTFENIVLRATLRQNGIAIPELSPDQMEQCSALPGAKSAEA